MRRGLFPILFTILLPALTADPRAKPTDYPAHAESARLAIGAEYMVHTFSNGRQSFFTPDYLVVDTAIYPHRLLAISQSNFHLVVNGAAFAPQGAEFVAYSLKSGGFDDNSSSRRARFPGDTGGANPPRAPQAPDPSRPDVQPGPESAEDVVVRTALQQGELKSPQSGFLYFPFSGKLKKIKSMDLVYSDDAGDLTVLLIP